MTLMVNLKRAFGFLLLEVLKVLKVLKVLEVLKASKGSKIHLQNAASQNRSAVFHAAPSPKSPGSYLRFK